MQPQQFLTLHIVKDCGWPVIDACCNRVIKLIATGLIVCGVIMFMLAICIMKEV